jgi:formate--tetrahydrofolate ligase
MTVLLKDALRPTWCRRWRQPRLRARRPVRQHRARLQLGDRHASAALKLADYVVTEAGFGADLGAEKFFDIKCRKAASRPSARCSSPPSAR